MSKNKLKPDVYRPIITKPVIIGPKAEPQISTTLKKERENILSGYFPEVVTGTFNSDYVYKYLTINEKILTIDGKGLTIIKN